MAKVFAKLFDTNGAAYQLPPLQALSAFFEFNELIPVGVDGDRVSRLLADYLASVDLIENAAAILTHQVRFRSQGDDRAQLALKLIDLHLANDRPDLAQQVMDVMANEKMPSGLLTRYNQLRAEVLVQQGKYPDALKMLAKDDSATARGLKLAVHWHQQEWEQVVSILEPEVKARAAKAATFTQKEEERILRLAIAYSKLRRFDDLKTLKQLVGKRIKNVEIGDSFDFVSDSPTPIDHTSLESSLDLGKIQSFLDKYRKQDLPVTAPVMPEEIKEEKPAPAEAGNTEEKKEEEKTEEKKEEKKE